MRLIDADVLECNIKRLCPSLSQPDGTGPGDDLVMAAQDMMVDVLQVIAEAQSFASPPNDPLTPEELLEMAKDELAVWCFDLDGLNQVLLFMYKDKFDDHLIPYMWAMDSDHNIGMYPVDRMLVLGAKFYRSKPDES